MSSQQGAGVAAAPSARDGGAGPAGCPCSTSGRDSLKRNWLYDKYFAALMWFIQGRYDKLVVPLKQQLFGQLMQDLVHEAAAAAAGAAGGAGAAAGGGAGAAAGGGAGAASGGGGAAAVSACPGAAGGGAAGCAPAQQGGAVLRVSVLELGIGGAPNLPYYTAAARAAASAPCTAGPAPPPLALRLVGVDPNPEMLRMARHAAEQAGLPAGWAFEAVQGSADALPFGEGEFDAVVITLVLCSVPSPAAALAEVRRVLRPGGQLLLLEHVAAPPERPQLRRAQEWLAPLNRLLGDGCNPNRDTLAAVKAAGFDAAGLRSFDVEGLRLLAPHISGVIRR